MTRSAVTQLAVLLFVVVSLSAVECRAQKKAKKATAEPAQGQGYRQTDTMGGGEAKPPAKGKFRVFILAGQSNMTGQGRAAELDEPYNKPHERIRIWANGRWEFLVPKQNFGPGVGMAHQLAAFWPDDTIGIVKVAIGGTGILAFAPHWSRQQADRTGDGHKGSLYKDIIDSVTAARAVSSFELAGFVWKQGGKDSKSAELGDEYLDNFTKMISALRKDLDAAKMPVFVATSTTVDRLGEVPEKLLRERPGAVAVLKAHHKAAEVIPNTRTIVHGPLPCQADGIHFNTEGQLTLGTMVADAIEEYYGKGR